MSDDVIEYGKHIRFEPRPPKPKTKVWAVVSKHDDFLLGYILWFAKWRKYSFTPEPNTVFEQDCLRDIADFCQKQTSLHWQFHPSRKKERALA